jgi:hypothetical protein
MSRHPSGTGQGFIQDSSDQLAGIGEGPTSGLHSMLYAGGNAGFQLYQGVLQGQSVMQGLTLQQQQSMIAMVSWPSVASGTQTHDDSIPADLDLVGMRPLRITDENNQRLIHCPWDGCGKTKQRFSEYR